MAKRAALLILRGYYRRLRFHWPLWLSVAGAVALVAIGFTLPNTFQRSTPVRGLDAAKAATILAICAIVVSSVQLVIMSLRVLIADQRYVRALFAMGATLGYIVVLRGAEMLIGCVVAAFMGLCFAFVTLWALFDSSYIGLSAPAVTRAIIVGLLPTLFVAIVPRVVRRFPS